MKKTYKNPEMEVVKIQAVQQLLTLSQAGSTDATSGNLARPFDEFEGF